MVKATVVAVEVAVKAVEVAEEEAAEVAEVAEEEEVHPVGNLLLHQQPQHQLHLQIMEEG